MSWTFVYVLYAEYIVRTFAIIFKSPWQNFTKTSKSLVMHKMNILCKNQEVSMCQSRDITWNTRKYREMSQNLRTFAIIFKSPWQNFTKTSESLVLHTMSILCKNQEVSMCQSRDITWNTRKYRQISQNLRTLAIILPSLVLVFLKLFLKLWQFPCVSSDISTLAHRNFLIFTQYVHPMYYLWFWSFGNILSRTFENNCQCTQILANLTIFPYVSSDISTLAHRNFLI